MSHGIELDRPEHVGDDAGNDRRDDPADNKDDQEADDLVAVSVLYLANSLLGRGRGLPVGHRSGSPRRVLESAELQILHHMVAV